MFINMPVPGFLDKSGVSCPENMELWRCEAQVKEVFGDSWFLLDVDKVSKFNPFLRMDFYDLFNIDTAGKGAYGLFVDVARSESIEYACARIPDRRTKKQYLSRLKSEMCPPRFNLPEVIYRNCFKAVYSRFVDSIKGLFEESKQARALIV